MESNTKTIAKRARVGPRKPVLSTMKMLFWRKLSSISSLESDMIILYHVLKLWIELIKYENDNATKKFYWLEVSQKFPMESNTKTIAKRARVGPRTPVLLTMIKSF